MAVANGKHAASFGDVEANEYPGLVGTGPPQPSPHRSASRFVLMIPITLAFHGVASTNDHIG